MLALVLVTDADDCSARPTDQVTQALFDTQADLGPMGLRCARRPGLASRLSSQN